MYWIPFLTSTIFIYIETDSTVFSLLIKKNISIGFLEGNVGKYAEKKPCWKANGKTSKLVNLTKGCVVFNEFCIDISIPLVAILIWKKKNYVHILIEHVILSAR